MERNLILKLLLILIPIIKAEQWDYLNSWGDVCATGTQQSPINIDITQVDKITCDADLMFKVTPNYGVKNVLIDTEHKNIQTNGNFSIVNATINGQSRIFSGLQFHIHQPSQHNINGTQYDCEIHFVHQTLDKSVDRDLLVIGVLFQAVDDSELFGNTFFDQWDFLKIQEKVDFDGGKAIHNLLKGHEVYINYDGSLTTPGCAQRVNWFVSPHIRKMKKSHMQKIHEIL